jgi:integrase/recombinase XerD
MIEKELSIGPIVHSFFTDYLKVQRGLSVASVRSYRDALRLFLQHVSKELRKPITHISISELRCEQVLSFLAAIEIARNNSVRTRNQRLAALHTFFRYVCLRVPESIAEVKRIGAISPKRSPPSPTLFLEKDEVSRLFRDPLPQGQISLRDRALLLFLYNTGARVQEVADLQIKNLEFADHPRVHLHGKGQKWRVCPLWKQTAFILQQVIRGREKNADEPVFLSSTGFALTRFGIYKIVRKHTKDLVVRKRSAASGRATTVSPHTFRHTAAVHLLESGVEINVIRAWLGHVSLDTTNRYAEINIRAKIQALEACEPPVDSKSLRKSKWRDDRSLLNWLESL